MTTYVAKCLLWMTAWPSSRMLGWAGYVCQVVTVGSKGFLTMYNISNERELEPPESWVVGKEGISQFVRLTASIISIRDAHSWTGWVSFDPRYARYSPTQFVECSTNGTRAAFFVSSMSLSVCQDICLASNALILVQYIQYKLHNCS